MMNNHIQVGRLYEHRTGKHSSLPRYLYTLEIEESGHIKVFIVNNSQYPQTWYRLKTIHIVECYQLVEDS